MTRGRNPGVGHTCPTCDRTILAGQHIRRAEGHWHHRDCQHAAAIAYNRAHPRRTNTATTATPRRTISGIPTVIDSRTGHHDNITTAEKTITNGHRQPRTWNEPGHGRHGGGHEP